MQEDALDDEVRLSSFKDMSKIDGGEKHCAGDEVISWHPKLTELPVVETD